VAFNYHGGSFDKRTRANRIREQQPPLSGSICDRDDGSEACTVQRDRLTTVIRSSLLDYPCLKAFDSRHNFRILIDESSIREEFSDTTLLKGDRVMAGAYVAFNLEIDEVVERIDLGQVEQIEVEANAVDSGDLPFAE